MIDIKLTPVEIEILLSLAEDARHGYGIKLAVEQRSGGRMSLGSGTLYVALQRLERDGLLRSDAKASGRKPASGTEKLRRRHFKLTSLGRKALKRELSHLDELLRYAKTLKSL